MNFPRPQSLHVKQETLLRAVVRLYVKFLAYGEEKKHTMICKISRHKSSVGEGLTEGGVASRKQDTSQDFRKKTEDQESSGQTDRDMCILVIPVRVTDHNHSGPS